jgi:hypothetical protein
LDKQDERLVIASLRNENQELSNELKKLRGDSTATKLEEENKQLRLRIDSYEKTERESLIGELKTLMIDSKDDEFSEMSIDDIRARLDFAKRIRHDAEPINKNPIEKNTKVPRGHTEFTTGVYNRMTGKWTGEK